MSRPTRPRSHARSPPHGGGREFGQLEVVGGKQREGLRLVVQVRGDAEARARPSKVLVPRPISSISTSECGVAVCRICAASVISSMKVDWALARSSAAPMRVWMASIGPRRQAAAGT
jgi:hypothetical protein